MVGTVCQEQVGSELEVCSEGFRRRVTTAAGRTQNVRGKPALPPALMIFNARRRLKESSSLSRSGNSSLPTPCISWEPEGAGIENKEKLDDNSQVVPIFLRLLFVIHPRFHHCSHLFLLGTSSAHRQGPRHSPAYSLTPFVPFVTRVVAFREENRRTAGLRLTQYRLNKSLLSYHQPPFSSQQFSLRVDSTALSIIWKCCRRTATN